MIPIKDKYKSWDLYIWVCIWERERERERELVREREDFYKSQDILSSRWDWYEEDRAIFLFLILSYFTGQYLSIFFIQE